jgi:hypothetical protein
MPTGGAEAGFAKPLAQETGCASPNLPVVAALTRPVVLAAVLVGFAILAAPTLLREGPDLRDRFVPAAGGSSEQSASQISPGEFELLREGMTPDQLGSYAGEPASKSSAKVEGIRLECWYYGAVGQSGAYQLCFKDDRLASKLRFGR